MLEKRSIIMLILTGMLSIWQTLNAAPISQQTAKTVAIHWYSSQQRDRKIVPEIKNIQKIQNVFVCKMTNGFVIVSSDDRLPPIIGYSANNPIKHIPPAFLKWIQQYHVSDIQPTNRKQTSNPLWNSMIEHKDCYITKASSEVLPLIKTQWKQNSPWNEKCPFDSNGSGYHAYAGCVAVAMAQIMKYWAYPDRGTGSHTYESNLYGQLSANFDIAYLWNNMSDTIASDSVKTLLYHCGISVEMDYGPNSSSADASTKPSDALTRYFKYAPSIKSIKRKDYIDINWTQLIREELSQQRPVLYYGSNQDNENGHAFVCDGYESNGYFHFNWGWGGSYDGYYSLNNVKPDSDSNYSYHQGAILNIEPSPPVNLTLPYEENFESNNVPDPWIVSGNHSYVGMKEAHTGFKALLLNDYTTTETGTGSAMLKINVPDEGATLRFFVKRGYSPSTSEYNQHKAEIRPEFGETILHSFFNDDFNDSAWQEFSLDLTPWKSEIITLYFEQNNSSINYRQWMSIDDVSIRQEPIAKFNADKTICYENQSIQFYNQSTMARNFLWQFGDGETSLEAQPVHQYNSPGRYTITLVVNNGDASLVKYNYIHVLPQYTPPYTIENGGNFDDQSYDFASGILSGAIDLWEQGTPGNILNTTHSGFQIWKTGLIVNIEKDDYICALMTPLFDLSAPGSYVLQFYHQMHIKYINCPGAAWMEYSIDKGGSWHLLGTYDNNPEGSLNWYNKSTHESLHNNSPCWWNNLDTWTCARLVIPELAGQSSVGFRFVYRVESGWGDVTYLIDGWSIDDFEIQHIPPTADFDHPKLAYANQTIQFKDQSVYAFSWKWTFGDQTIQTDQHPTHTYISPGFYTISLEINNGDDIAIHEKGIHVLPERGIPYVLDKGGSFDVNVDDFDSQNIMGSIDIWEHGQAVSGQSVLQSDSNVWKTSLNSNITRDDYQCALYTPNFKPRQQGIYEINFDMSMDVPCANGPFAVQCQYSTNNGKSWTRLGEDNDSYGQNWYNRGPSSDVQIFATIFNDQMGWTGMVNNIPISYRMDLQTSVTQIAFRFVFSVIDVNTTYDCYNSDGFMIDNFSITGPSSGQPDLWLSDHQLNLASDEDSQYIDIKNMGENSLNWQIVNTIQWLNVQPSSGQNDAVITISCDQNTGQKRSGLITIQSENALNGIQYVYFVQQEAIQSPVISAIDDVTIKENSTDNYVYFTVTDEKTPNNKLNLWVISNNISLIPNNYNELRIGGPVDQRYIYIVPAIDQTGTAIISIFAKDGDGLIAQKDVYITVQEDVLNPLDINNDQIVDIEDIIIGLRILSGYTYESNNSLDLSMILKMFKRVNVNLSSF